MRCSRSNRKGTCLLLAVGLWWGVMTAAAQDLRQYTLHIDLPKGGHISGICLIRMEGDRGAMSVVNEFGVKAFDAVYPGTRRRVKLRHVIGPLDKWYIRRVIAKDMSVLFRPNRRLPRRRTLERRPDGSLILTNKRFKITYRFKPLEYDATE